MTNDDSMHGTRRWPWSVALILPLAALGLACLVWWERDRSTAEARGMPAPASAPVDAGVQFPSLGVGTAGGREDARPEATPKSTLPPLGEDELRAALRRLAQVDMQDSAALEAALRPLLVPTDNIFAVLERLKAGGLASDAQISLEEVGALRCLTLAALVFNPSAPATGVLQAEGVQLDGRALVLTILRALPDILAPVRELLADLLSGMRDGNGHAVLDQSYAAELERLAAAYPELAELFQRMLADMLEGLEPDAAAALQALYLGDTSSPAQVAAGLARWLEEKPASALAWAAQAYDAEGASDDLRHAITSAISKSAPVHDASQFLSERATRMMLVEFLTVGDRDGGQAALDEQYWGLRINGDADERARTMLVSGMASAKTETLLAMTLEDPSTDVRSQAWITLTFAEHFVPHQAVLDRLDEAWDHRGDPQLGITTSGLVAAAANFAHKSESAPELRAGALELLRNVVHDRSQTQHDRKLALDKLQKYVSAQEFEQLAKEL